MIWSQLLNLSCICKLKFNEQLTAYSVSSRYEQSYSTKNKYFIDQFRYIMEARKGFSLL